MASTTVLDKITLIKIVRSFTDYGIVDAKFIADEFCAAWGMNAISDTNDLIKFIRFISNFVKGNIKVEKGVIAWVTPKALTHADIHKLSE